MKSPVLLCAAALALCVSSLSAETFTLSLADFTDGSGAKPGPGWVAEEGGVIHRAAKQGDLISTQDYTNFTIEWDWKLAEGANSGLKYWVNKFDKGGWLGIEYQMIDDDRHPDAHHGDNHSTACFYDLKAVGADKPVKPAGEWNTSKVTSKDGKLQHFLNGKLVGELDRNSDEWKACQEKSKFKAVEGFAPSHGHFLLQDHGDEVWFRNIRVTPQ